MSRTAALLHAATDRKEANRILSVTAAAWMVHVRNRATLLAAGGRPERIDRANQFVSNSRSMLATALGRYLRTL